jgi:hypothetical protein
MRGSWMDSTASWWGQTAGFGDKVIKLRIPYKEVISPAQQLRL